MRVFRSAERIILERLTSSAERKEVKKLPGVAREERAAAPSTVHGANI